MPNRKNISAALVILLGILCFMSAESQMAARPHAMKTADRVQSEFRLKRLESFCESPTYDPEKTLIIEREGSGKTKGTRIQKLTDKSYAAQFTSVEEKYDAEKELISAEKDILLKTSTLMAQEIDTEEWKDFNLSTISSSEGQAGYEPARICTATELCSRGITVAVIDSGYDLAGTDDFSERIIDVGINISGTGKTDSIQDDHGHGTELSNIILSNTNSVVKVMPVKVVAADGTTSALRVVAGMEEAILNGADVINLSLNAYQCEKSTLLHEEIEKAKALGIFVVVSAGNSGEDVKEYTPANVEDAIVVTAVNSDGQFMGYSNYGDTVDYCSYGTVDCMGIGGQLYRATGTSVSAAMVSTVIANTLALNASADYESVLETLNTHAADLGSRGWDRYFGNGALTMGSVDAIYDTTATCNAEIFQVDWKMMTDMELNELLSATTPINLSHFLKSLDEEDRLELLQRDTILNQPYDLYYFKTKTGELLESRHYKKYAEYLLENEFGVSGITQISANSGWFRIRRAVNGVAGDYVDIHFSFNAPCGGSTYDYPAGITGLAVNGTNTGLINFGNNYCTGAGMTFNNFIGYLESGYYYWGAKYVNCVQPANSVYTGNTNDALNSCAPTEYWGTNGGYNSTSYLSIDCWNSFVIQVHMRDMGISTGNNASQISWSSAKNSTCYLNYRTNSIVQTTNHYLYNIYNNSWSYMKSTSKSAAPGSRMNGEFIYANGGTDGLTVYNGVDYSAVYNFYDYEAYNADIRNAYGADQFGALQHFVLNGMAEGRVASKMFSFSTYYNNYGDLRYAFGGDRKSYYMHYINCGLREGRVASSNRFGTTDGNVPTALHSAYHIWSTANPSPGIAGTIAYTCNSHYYPNSYFLYFNANGGNCSQISKKVWYSGYYGGGEGTSYSTFPVPVRKGYSFMGWYTETTGGTKVSPESVYRKASNTTIYAHWSPVSYQILYCGNGATSGKMENSSHEYDLPGKLSLNVYKREYEITYDACGGICKEKDLAAAAFTGWSDSMAGQVLFSDGEEVVNLTDVQNDVVKLYAGWKLMSVELPLPERAGYDFAGWYTEIENGTRIGVAGTYYTPEKSIVLYARWNRKFDIAYMSAKTVETEDWVDTNEGNDYVTGCGDITFGEAPENWYLVRESIDSEDYITEKGVGWSFIKDQDVSRDGDYYPDGSSVSTEFFYEDALKANAVTTGGPKEEYRGQRPPSLTDQTAIVNLYRVWDLGPEISGNDLYYTLEEAKNGIITEEELLSHAEAVDEEDGIILPGSREENSFVVLDYTPEDFSYFVSGGSVTETYAAVDSAKNCTLHRITVHIVDTQIKAVEEIHEKGVTRFINEFYYEKPARQGGLESTSVWLADAEYREELLLAFDRMRRGTPEKTVVLN